MAFIVFVLRAVRRSRVCQLSGRAEKSGRVYYYSRDDRLGGAVAFFLLLPAVPSSPTFVIDRS